MPRFLAPLGMTGRERNDGRVQRRGGMSKIVVRPAYPTPHRGSHKGVPLRLRCCWAYCADLARRASPAHIASLVRAPLRFAKGAYASF